MRLVFYIYLIYCLSPRRPDRTDQNAPLGGEVSIADDARRMHFIILNQTGSHTDGCIQSDLLFTVVWSPFHVVGRLLHGLMSKWHVSANPQPTDEESGERGRAQSTFKNGSVYKRSAYNYRCTRSACEYCVCALVDSLFAANSIDNDYAIYQSANASIGITAYTFLFCTHFVGYSTVSMDTNINSNREIFDELPLRQSYNSLPYIALRQ